MPRILRIINRLNLGGPTYNVAYLSKFLEPEYETMIVSGEKDETEESSEFILKNMGLSPHYIPKMRREISPVGDHSAYLEIKRIIQEFKPDIVHTHAAKAGTLGRLAASACKVPVIVHTFHGHVFNGYFSPFKTKIFIEIEKFLSKKSNAIVAISNKQKHELTQIFKVAPEDKTHVIRLGFDLEKFQMDIPRKREKFRSEYLIEHDELVITIVGRLVPIKNHSFLLKAIKRLKPLLSDKIRFFIVGDGELKYDLINQCQELSLPFTWFTDEPVKKLITFTSWRKDIDVVNAGSDLIILCSLNEGTPVSLIEAQASGKPVLSSNVGGVEDVVSPASGWLYESNNMDEFCDKLLRLIENEKIRSQMAANGWEQVKNQFTYTRLVKDMDNLYKTLLSS